jgi:hypothetical protein
MKELRELRAKVKFRSADPSPLSLTDIRELDPVEEIKVLTSEVKRRRRQTEEARRNCIRAEVEAQSARQKAELLEAEIERLRGELSQAETKQADADLVRENATLHQQLRQSQDQIKSLTHELQRSREDKKRQNERVSEVWGEVERLKRSIDSRRSLVPEERQDLSEYEGWIEEKSKLLTELNTARLSLETMHRELGFRDEAIQSLERSLEEESREREALLETLVANFALSSQPAEPPPESTSLFSPIIDIDPQAGSRRTLLSDVGSTGASFPRRQREESKEVHYASPDPLENLLHQSTGETMQDNKECEAATPPYESLWGESAYLRTPPTIHHDFEEEEKQGTPKRDEALSGRASRSSTPPRHYDRPISPAPQQNASQRVHNLTQPSQPTHYSIASTNPFQSSGEGDDFFDMMAQESEPRRKVYGSVPKSLFD